MTLGSDKDNLTTKGRSADSKELRVNSKELIGKATLPQVSTCRNRLPQKARKVTYLNDSDLSRDLSRFE